MNYTSQLADLSTHRRSLQALVKRLRSERHQARETLAHAEEARALVVSVAQAVQQKAHKHIARVVSRCLTAIFDDPPKFKIVFERKRGKTEARLVFVKDKAEYDPMTASGGGMVDVAAFALRLACLMLSRPKLRPLLVIDEPFRFVHADIRPRIRTLLETLSQELKVQIILVTHDPELQCGKVIEL